MKNLQKLILFLIVALVAIIANPIFSHAATNTPVATESAFLEAIQSFEDGDTITLSDDIDLSSPVEINNGKSLTINGGGHTISRNTETWHTDSANGTLLTVGGNSVLTLSNLTLTNSQKYGAQAYNGGYLILDGVTISGCGYGGVLANAGTVEVRNLDLKHNGRPDSNNGIEIGKSEAISDSPNDPVIKMNGTLTSNQTENVIVVAINDKLADFEVINEEDSENKIFLNENQLVVTDENNNILYKSNEIDEQKIQFEGTTYAKNVAITVHLMDKTVTVESQDNKALSEDDIKSQINLETLGISNYTLDGFYYDANYAGKVEFPKTFTENTDIYAKLTLIQTPDTQNPETQEPAQEPTQEKDSTPKTGIDSSLSIALFALALSIIVIAILKKEI